ncbi:FtsK/SpoIIIE domain-containing protein [Cytobacillus luteolus]|uniref:FtsK/SpoIIIE domain-containing protein n=1 Tax=Litchfieldia luteola TaxID=682179 RepID=UPI001AE97017|nr:FtsK/SpoIIIE domain-containing protein [Cytobacillus luteolus]MBP1944652.1 S-DNA-T family DNA segregation ATPase FtsK/SpoIIIE [Cytobacillus luteolus]
MGKVKAFFRKQKAKTELKKAFNNAGLYNKYKNGDKEIKVYPKIHSVSFDDVKKTTSYVFTLLNGMDPKEVTKKEYVLLQHFGKNIEIEGDHKKFELTIYERGMKDKLTYNYEDIEPVIKGMKVPIVCGINKNGEWIAYDAKTEPNALISGEPGSGKSTQLRSILCTLIKYKSPEELQMYLGDLKMSEFHLFKGVKHVKEVSVFPEDLEKMLAKVYKEMVNRSKTLNKYGVMHIDDLPEGQKVPYIVLAIDEIVMVMDNKEVKRMLVQIDSLGRALGIYNLLSLQRPSHDILDTKVRSLLTVRMGFRTTDASNAKIIGTPGSEKISKDVPGRFILKRDTLDEIQAPFLTEKASKKLLEGYKSLEQEDTLKNESEENVEDIPATDLREEDIFNGGVTQ